MNRREEGVRTDIHALDGVVEVTNALGVLGTALPLQATPVVAGYRARS